MMVKHLVVAAALGSGVMGLVIHRLPHQKTKMPQPVHMASVHPIHKVAMAKKTHKKSHHTRTSSTEISSRKLYS